MEKFDYGPVEIYIIEFAGTAPDPAVMRTVEKLSAESVVRVLDMVVATRAEDGTAVITEITDAAGEAPHRAVQGLLGEEDIAAALDMVQPGSGVALVAMELCWAKELAQHLAAAKGRVIHSERIPAPVVNTFISETATSDD